MIVPGVESRSTRISTARKPRCSRCGACCLKQGSGFTMTPADFKRWKDEQREDILRYVPLHHTETLDHDVWIDWADPDTHEPLAYCPFLTMVDHRAYACAINEMKPDICRSFWCEWSHGMGRRGQPFRSGNGQTAKATPVAETIKSRQTP